MKQAEIILKNRIATSSRLGKKTGGFVAISNQLQLAKATNWLPRLRMQPLGRILSIARWLYRSLDTRPPVSKHGQSDSDWLQLLNSFAKNCGLIYKLRQTTSCNQSESIWADLVWNLSLLLVGCQLVALWLYSCTKARVAERLPHFAVKLPSRRKNATTCIGISELLLQT